MPGCVRCFCQIRSVGQSIPSTCIHTHTLPSNPPHQESAAHVGTTISVPPPLSTFALEGAAPSTSSSAAAAATAAQPLKLGLSGEHQLVNGSLAVQLVAAWEAAAGGARGRERAAMVARGVLPREYRAGLEAATWPGRSQVGGAMTEVTSTLCSAFSRL